MLKHRYGFVCALIAVLISSGFVAEAQSQDPSTLPLIQFADLSYVGAFRLPREFANDDNFAHGGTPIAFNPYRNSLFVSSRHGKVAEVTIPSVVSSNDITKLPFASYLQGFYEPTEGTISQITGGDVSIAGLLVQGNRLYGTASIYYDANNVQRISHYSRSTVLSSVSTIGMKQVWTDQHTGFVSGYLATIPTEWQQKLGGTAATGQCCIPIAWRTSWGPSAFAFNPADIVTSAKVAAAPLLYYSDAHPTLGPWEGNNPVYSAATEITGMAFIAGSRTALYFGRTGTGPFCYGEGTNDPSLAGADTGDGSHYCYDPTNAAKGQHGYPYNYQIWAYDLNDFAAVKAGTKNPWDVRPYGVWPFSLPFNASQIRIGGIGYDASRQIIYISQIYGDQDTYDNRPLIHALKVNGVVGAPLPAPDTTPLPQVITTGGSPTAGPARLTALAMTSNKTAPQPANTTITFTATPTGGVAPHQYKWLVHNGLQWIELQGWSTANTFNWTPSLANSQYRIGVWVRSDGNTADTAEFTQSADFAIGNATNWSAPYEATKSVTIAADKAAPQAAGSMITWTATPGGGQAPHQYKWLVHNGLQWNVVNDWSASNTFVWTPALGNSQYRVGVWVRSNGGTADAAEASASADFAITGVSGTPTPPPSATPARLTALALTANKVAPQPAQTTITFTATPTGGVAPHQYKWLIHNGLQWNVVNDWTTNNTFNWTPSAANSQYRVGVWVRSAGLTADSPEFTQSMDFAITAAAASSPPPPPPPAPTPSGPLAAISITPNKAAPQAAGTTITFSASPTGGASPEYKWLVHNGLTWTPMTGWSTANTFNWTPGAANPGYRVGVWARNAGVTADTPQVTNSIDYPISVAAASAPAPPPPSTTPARLTAVVISADRVAPQPAGTTITFAAVPNGGAAPQQYKWLVHDGLNWNAVTGWSTASTFSWTPPSQNSAYRVGVWVRSAGLTADTPEVTSSIDFAISAAALAPPPPPPSSSSARLTDVRITSNVPAPQIKGTTITFTAIPTGGTAHQYKWLIHNGTSWSAVTGWSSANTFAWTPASANPSYRVGVWVRTSGSTADVAEFTMSIDFAIR